MYIYLYEKFYDTIKNVFEVNLSSCQLFIFFFFIFYKNVKTGTEKIRCILKTCRVISETTSDFSVPRQKDKREK